MRNRNAATAAVKVAQAGARRTDARGISFRTSGAGVVESSRRGLEANRPPKAPYSGSRRSLWPPSRGRTLESALLAGLAEVLPKLLASPCARLPHRGPPPTGLPVLSAAQSGQIGGLAAR